MGTIMQESLIGGQIVYPLLDEDWREVPGRRAEITDLMIDINHKSSQQVHISIELGGMLVLAGNASGLKALMERLPMIDRFPMSLANHAAFHTELQKPNSERGLEALPANFFTQSDIPLIDGRGAIWQHRSRCAASIYFRSSSDRNL